MRSYLLQIFNKPLHKKKSLLFVAILLPVFVALIGSTVSRQQDDLFLSYIVETKKLDTRLYWKNDRQENFGSIQNLQQWLHQQGKELVFAMNGGMYKTDRSPLGLFIENGKRWTPLNTKSAEGNFYLKPNGLFCITNDDTPVIYTTAQFHDGGKIKYATQSGPILLIDGGINMAFKPGSANLNIRNGVGILPGNKVIFAMSKQPVSFYDFANYFKKVGCSNALYLDGFVSRTYLPEKNWLQTDGNFGVIIGVTKPATGTH